MRRRISCRESTIQYNTIQYSAPRRSAALAAAHASPRPVCHLREPAPRTHTLTWLTGPCLTGLTKPRTTDFTACASCAQASKHALKARSPERLSHCLSLWGACNNKSSRVRCRACLTGGGIRRRLFTPPMTIAERRPLLTRLARVPAAVALDTRPGLRVNCRGQARPSGPGPSARWGGGSDRSQSCFGGLVDRGLLRISKCEIRIRYM